MGTPGVPWTVDKLTIVEALKKRKGAVTLAAKDLSCCYTTLNKRIKEDEELKELVSQLRNAFTTELLDSAEDTLLYALDNKDQDLANALKSSFYVLNNKGKERGYAHPTDAEATVEISKKFDDFMGQLSDLRSARKMADMSNNAE